LERLAPPAARALHPTEHIDKAAMYRNVVKALREHAQRRTTIVVLEDMHWADEASIELLGFLLTELSGIRRLLVVGTLRAAEAPDALRSMQGAPGTTAINLCPLEPAACAALVHALLPNEADGSSRVAHIVELSGGNPFFAEELCKSAGSTEIPNSVQKAIGSRLTRIAERDRRTLECAAVLGERFELGLLANVLRLPPATVASRLHAGQRSGIVVEERNGAFRFGHALTRAVLLANMTAARRMQMHERAARALERSRRFDALGFAQLAYHYAGAHDRRKAYTYHMRAGDLAYGVHAYGDAAKFYGDAAAAAEPGSLQYARALKHQGDALFRCPALTQAESVYRKAVAVYRAADAAEDLAIAYQSLSLSVYNQDRPRDALAVIEEALAALPDVSPHLRVSLNVQAVFNAGDFDPALARKWLANIQEDEVRDLQCAGLYYSIRAGIEATFGAAESWQRTVDAFRKHAESMPPTGPYLGYYGNIAATALFLGFPAGEMYERSFTIARALEMRVYEAAYSSHAAFERWLHGDREAFSRYARRAAAADSPGIPALHAYVLLCSLLEDASYVPPADEVYAILAGRRNEFFGPLAGRYAMRLAERGDGREAMRVLDAAADALEYPYAAWETLVAMAELGSPAARERARELMMPYRDSPAPTFAATAAMVDAFCAYHAGDAESRDRAAARAHQLYASIGWIHHANRAADLQPARLIPRLSPREGQIAELLRQGRTNRAMAAELFISEKTVEKHVASVFEKLNVNNRAAAVRALSEAFLQR
jgi:DNA-binding NarL/FixJ family response regulator